jgi:hypothetical protein
MARAAARCAATRRVQLRGRCRRGLSSYEARSDVACPAAREGATWPVQLRGRHQRGPTAVRCAAMLCGCEGGDAACTAAMGAVV